MGNKKEDCSEVNVGLCGCVLKLHGPGILLSKNVCISISWLHRMTMVISRDMQLNLAFGHLRFRVTKVEHKSNSKERKSLMSVTGVESLNGDMPATPAKPEAKEAPGTPVKEGTQERRSSE